MFEFDGIGTHWWIENLANGDFDGETKQAVPEYVQEFDNQYSRFKPESMIGILNKKKYLKDPPETLLAMFNFCKGMYEISDGAFDITVGGVLHSQGYGNREMASNVATNFWNEMKYNRDEIIIPAGAVIDTGGYGKGWLIDELVDLLVERGYTNVIVNGGGDIRIENETAIEFALEHPYDLNKKIGSTRIQNGALAVSTMTKRAWKHAGISYHHIVDPCSGGSLETDVVATFVRAQNARTADTLATICMIRPDLESEVERICSANVVVLRDNQIA